MKKLLITGFEPFGGETVNPSWETVSLLPDTIGDYALTKLRIPVVFGQAADTILAKAETLLPDAILCIGQAGGRAAITPEMVGINLRHAPIPDNAGSQPQDEPALVGGEKTDVMAVGDNVNDEAMIREFYSYAMENGVDSVKNLADRITVSIEELIEKEL